MLSIRLKSTERHNMAIRNTVGRRLLSDAELEFTNPFDETIYNNLLETFNAPTEVAAPVEQPTAPASVPSIEKILAQGGGSPVVIDGIMYQPIFDSTGQGDTFEQGPLTQVIAYKPGETATGQSYKTYSPNMQEIGTGAFKDVGNFGDLLKTAGQDLAPLAAMALTMGGTGGLLGSALTGGSLSGTAASALGNALISGGAGALTGQDPLKAALLAAGGTYAGSLFGGPSAATEATLTDAQFVAADAAQLAAQGLGADQIEQVLRASGVNTVTAVAAADAATSGMNVDQIAKDITLGNRGLFTDTTATTTPTTVTTSPEGLQTVTTTATAPTVNAGGLLAAVPSAVLPPSNIVSTPLAPLDQQVTVTGTKATPTLEDALASVAPLATITAPSVTTTDQVIDVTGTKAPTVTQDDLIAAITNTINPVVTPTVTPPTTTADQVIEVTGTKKETTPENIGAVTVTAPEILKSVDPDVGPQSEGGVETQDQTDRTTNPNTLLSGLTLADILKALASVSSLGMLGGIGTDGTGTGTTTSLTPITPVPVGNADYYNAVQQYYNTYMPQTPRNVATPLQQWYEGKFGG